LNNTKLGEISRSASRAGLGYEDLNDHEQLRHDPLMAVLAGRAQAGNPGGKSSAEPAGVARRQQSLPQDRLCAGEDRHVALRSVQSSRTPKRQPDACSTWTRPTSRSTASAGAVLPMATRQLRYLPLYIFAGDRLLGARLRPSNVDGGRWRSMKSRRIVAQLRSRWPKYGSCCAATRLLSEELMACARRTEQRGLPVRAGRATSRLQKIIGKQCTEANCCTPRPASARVFTEFNYQTHKSWRGRGAWSKSRVLGQGRKTRDSSLLTRTD